MKASELLAILQKLISEHGDCDVYIWDECFPDEPAGSIQYAQEEPVEFRNSKYTLPERFTIWP